MRRFAEFSRRRRVTSGRRGQMLLMFFVFLLAFLPLMALIVDLSLVRLARREMQSAVNAAALEGLRGKGLSQYSSLQRRRNSADLRIRMTDEGREWWESGPDVDERFRFRLGFTNELELNLDNAVNGDLVAGKYIHRPQDDEDHDHREGFDRKHTDYPFDRRDFIPFTTETEVVQLDVDGAESEAFLARRRRTSRNESVPGVSSQEMPVPVFFGHFWPSIEDVRENHVTIRAAAIAAARPAMIVGPSFRDSQMPELRELSGAAPFAISVADWRSWDKDGYHLNRVQARLDPISGDADVAPLEVAWLDFKRSDLERSVAVGHPLGLFESVAPTIDVGKEFDEIAYLPLWEPFAIANGDVDVQLIVGFGGIRIQREGGQQDDGNDVQVTVTRLPQFVAPHNAAAVARNGWQQHLAAHVEGLDLSELVERVWARADELARDHDGLLAPTLVRAMEPTPPRRPEPE